MELEIYRALVKINVPAEDAQQVAESINKEIDRRYALHEKQLFTKADGAALEAKIAQGHTEIIKWSIGAIFAAVGLFATITKFWH